ncbi:hypothetical protein I0C86_25905 [Plantactinospora sp. S1510]|uniref:Uncharacterized protein n=1 Tax=Plantactinospora alkalitolerans TaxID=2789879 RepID=A0ABS0H1L5_9ACTN|nr:hypothetical protein [Plantactinospora alkalitolerans]MBF9132356.1 hypothetical protein [Plantactinospora alkalitolerans]
MRESASVTVPSGPSDRPAAARARRDPATILLWVLVLEHLYALVTPPYEVGVEHGFHLSFGIAYAWLALGSRFDRGWRRALLTALLAIQFIGRFFVFALITDTWIRASLVPGALITLVLIALLWRRPKVVSAL